MLAVVAMAVYGQTAMLIIAGIGVGIVVGELLEYAVKSAAPAPRRPGNGEQ